VPIGNRLGLQTPTGTIEYVRVRILRGAHEVGGNYVEVEHDGARIILDLGWPLTVEPDVDLPLPSVAGLANDNPSLLGIVLSHPHFDHYGLLAKVPRSAPVYSLGRPATSDDDSASVNAMAAAPTNQFLGDS